MVTARDDVVGLDSSIILPRQTWVASGHVGHLHRPADRVPVVPQAVPRRPPAGGARGQEGHRRPRRGRARRHRLPQLRQPGAVDRAARVQHDAQDPPRRDRGRVRPALPAPRDRPGHLPQLPERREQASRKKPPFGIAQTGKSFRNEITPGNFIFRTREFEQMEMEFFVKPGEDEQWHQYWIDERTRWYVDLGISAGEPAPLRAPARRSCRTTPSAPSTSSTASRSPALSGVSWRASPTAPTSTSPRTPSTPARTCPTSTRRPASATCPTSSSRPRACPASLMTFLVDAYAEDEAPNTKGGVDKRVVLRLDPRAGAGQGRGAAAVAQRRPHRPRPATSPPSCAGPGTSTSTTPARSAAATAARTRSARRSA